MRRKKLVSIFTISFISIILAGCTSSKDIEETENIIDQIGEVDFNSETDILKAEEAYNELSAKEQNEVINYDELEDARDTYDTINKFVSVGEEYEMGLYTFLSEDKRSITAMSNPLNKEGFNYTDAIENMKAVNTSLGLPDSLFSKMTSTRALDGRQTEVYDFVIVSWTYHPNQGLYVLYELTY